MLNSFISPLFAVRYIVWGFIYAITFGKHSFFPLPNLTEDCGFFESFVPVWEYTYLGDDAEEKSSKKSKKQKESQKGTVWCDICLCKSGAMNVISGNV